MTKFALACALWVVAVNAQYPGQYPPGQSPSGQYPPGQYPPGQNGPLGGGGLSIPKRGKNKKSQKEIAALPTLTAEGRTLTNDGKKLVIETEDGRTITMTLTPKTTFVKAGADVAATTIVEGMWLRTESAEDDESNLTATKVEVMKDRAPEKSETVENAPKAAAVEAAKQSPAETAELSRPAVEDAPGRPVLRRGKPKKAGADEDDDTSTPAAQPAAAKTATAVKKVEKPKADGIDFVIGGEKADVKPMQSDALIQRTTDWAMTFTEGLPNYVCQQATTRYMEESRSSGWTAQDVVTAKVVFEDGRESYRDITVGGKRVNKGMLELGGSTSTGEFASTLHGLFAPFSDAQFKFDESTTVAGTPAAIYKFKVALKRSGWSIQVGGQLLRPAYSGSIWVDKATAQVRRIEMGADRVPKDFPMDAIETTVDYEPVRLGTGVFLLPVHSENLACQRGTTVCTKNVIDFRDYHKYSGESTIEFK